MKEIETQNAAFRRFLAETKAAVESGLLSKNAAEEMVIDTIVKGLAGDAADRRTGRQPFVIPPSEPIEADPLEYLIKTRLDWQSDRITWRYMTATDIGKMVGIASPTQSQTTRIGLLMRTLNGNASRRVRGISQLLSPLPVTPDQD